MACLAIACIGGLLAGCGGTGAPQSALGNGGDPGGQILAKMRTLNLGVPDGSVVVGARGQEPHWIGSCGYGYSADTLHKGWSQLLYLVEFTSSDSVSGVEKSVIARLSSHGWESPKFSGPLQWYGTPSTDPNAQSSNSTLMNNYFVDFQKGLTTTGEGTQARLTGATPVSGYLIGQPILWSLSVSAQPHLPVGSCNGG